MVMFAGEMTVSQTVIRLITLITVMRSHVIMFVGVMLQCVRDFNLWWLSRSLLQWCSSC